MAAFFENPLFLFVDEAEPILPVFRSPEYSDSGRKIVELADVACDTETTFPIHFLHSKFNQQRRGTDGFESARRITKGRNERSTNFSARTATILDDFESRKEKYMESKPWRNDRNDVYSADLDYNSCSDDFYDDWEFSNDAAGYNDYYTDFVTPQNMIERSRKERPSQNVRYSRNYEVPFSRGNRASRERNDRAYYQRVNTCPLWFVNGDERNPYETRNTDGRSRRLPLSEHRKRMKLFPGADGFNHDAGSKRNRVGPKRREREDASFDYVNSIRFSKNDDWHFTSLENEQNYEELMSSNSAAVNNHRHLQEVMSQNLNLQQTRVNVMNSENSEFTKTREKNSFSKNPIKGAKYQVLKNDATIEKTFQPNLRDTNTPRVRSAGVTTDQRLLNMRFMEKAATNVNLRSTVEERKNDVSCATSTERRAESANSTPDNRRHRGNSGNAQVRPCNKPLNETGCSAKSMFKLAAARNNGRTCGRNNVGSRIGSANKSSEIDRANRTVLSRSAPEEVIENAGASISELPSISPRAEAEKTKISRLPVRTWKRVRTRGPATLHLESGTTSGAVGEKFQDVDVVLESAQLNKPKGAEDDEALFVEVMARDRASGRRDDLKPKEHYKTGESHVADKPGSALGDLKGLKGTKSLNKGTPQQRRKRTN
ncbi:uncharacterized protein LOC116845054 [Odontomachus brunneus]|uniref:uncharacterized protein LOC116845054 n=1 Tax=Odontomachus brunneus TaxID=486640 RepID=UPI0013F20568|nr:uncharacterized protein LOC116845054 [Odontomachus brunneus]